MVTVSVVLISTIALVRGVPLNHTHQTARSAARVVAIPPTIDRTPNQILSGREQGLADLLAVLFADQPSVKAVERARLAAVLSEHKLALTGLTDAQTAARAGGLLKADAFIISTLTVENAQLVLIANVVEVNGARISATVREAAAPAALLDVVRGCAIRLAAALNVNVEPPKDADLDLAPGVSLRLMRGTVFTNDGLPLRAAVEYMRILAVDPMHEEAGARLAETLAAGNRSAQAAQACRLFLDRHPKSDQAERVRQLMAECERQADAAARNTERGRTELGGQAENPAGHSFSRKGSTP